MKRSLVFLIAIIIEILASILLLFSVLPVNYCLLILLSANIMIFILIITEPYWKLGAILVYMMFIEVMCYILNIFSFDRFVFFHHILNLLVLSAGAAITALAFKMNLEESRYVRNHDHKAEENVSKKNKIIQSENEPESSKKKTISDDPKLSEEEKEILTSDILNDDDTQLDAENTADDENDELDIEKDDGEFKKPSEIKEVVLKALIYTAKDSTIHLEDCNKIAKLESSEKAVVGSKRYAQSMKYVPCKVCKPY
jgi:hypothetical protein